MPGGRDPKDALAMVRARLEELNQIVFEARSSGDYETGEERLGRWKERTVQRLTTEVHPREGEGLAARQKMTFRMGDPAGNLVDEARMFAAFLEALERELMDHPADVLDVPIPVGPDATVDTPPPPGGTNIFLVHGHDELNLLRLKELVRDRWGLNPIVLSSEAGRGRSLIEKFEAEAQRASFAFVLLTSDDTVETPQGTYTQARPNVVFELGWFYGRLGRERVCILFAEGTAIHSDLDGISRVQFQSSVLEKTAELERELVAAKIVRDREG